jgi:hypothetical protein
MMRKFQYQARPDEVRQFLERLGFATDLTYGRYEPDPIGFTVRGTTVRLDYDLVVDGRIVAFGMISMLNTPISTGDDPQIAAASVKLYEKLYRRFRTPRT